LLLAELDAAGTRYTVLSPPTRAWPILAVSFARSARRDLVLRPVRRIDLYRQRIGLSSKAWQRQRVLTAMGFEAEKVLGAVRYQLRRRTNTTDEIHSAAQAINTAWRRRPTLNLLWRTYMPELQHETSYSPDWAKSL
jgi:hypothetical protein